ncbi:hypothetical protein Tco_0169308 [Tanacetum coccineum]
MVELEKKDDGHASDDEKTIRINWLQELDNLEKIESMDLVQKARVNWEVEGDENSKKIHGLINSRRKSQMIHGIMHDGVWISEPKDIKEAFLNSYKDKFSCHDSSISFPPVIPTHRHNTSDIDFLDVMVSMDEIKTEAFVVNFFSTSTFPQGSNSFFILFIPKVIDSIISPEQSDFISSRQILDGPLILSDIIDWYKKCKKKLMLFKVDFEKAFDSDFYPRQWESYFGVFLKERIETKGTLCRLSYLSLLWKVLVDHFKARMSGWKANLLSIGGRLTLIKSVLGSLGIYYLSIFKVPEIVVKSIESLRVAFFWGGHEHTKKIAWVKSSNTLASLDKVGFGAGSLKAFNKALLLKWKMDRSSQEKS